MKQFDFILEILKAGKKANFKKRYAVMLIALGMFGMNYYNTEIAPKIKRVTVVNDTGIAMLRHDISKLNCNVNELRKDLDTFKIENQKAHYMVIGRIDKQKEALINVIWNSSMKVQDKIDQSARISQWAY